MFCFQCQEAAKNVACTVRGVCGKPEETANLQDLLIFVLKGMAVYGEKLKEIGIPQRSEAGFIAHLFKTIEKTEAKLTSVAKHVAARAKRVEQE